MRNRRCWCAFA